MRLLLAVAVLVLNVAGLTNADCSGQALKEVDVCYNKFIAGYGMAYPPLPEYWAFHDVRRGWLDKQGLAVQQKICDIGNGLVSCTKPNRNCIDKKIFATMGQNSSDAQNYYTDLLLTEYQCTPRGLDLMMKNFYCIATCREHNQAKMDACNNALLPNVIIHGRCPAYGIFMDCMGDIYANCCGAGAGEFFCGTTRAGINAMDDSCDKQGKLKQCKQAPGSSPVAAVHEPSTAEISEAAAQLQRILAVV